VGFFTTGSAFPHREIRLHSTENSDEKMRANLFVRAVDCDAGDARTGSRTAVCGSVSRERTEDKPNNLANDVQRASIEGKNATFK